MALEIKNGQDFESKEIPNIRLKITTIIEANHSILRDYDSTVSYIKELSSDMAEGLEAFLVSVEIE